MKDKLFLKRFEVSNYKGLKDQIELNFNMEKPNITFVGDNGSGKSNILEAIANLEYFIKGKDLTKVTYPRIPISNSSNDTKVIPFKYVLGSFEGREINISYERFSEFDDVIENLNITDSDNYLDETLNEINNGIFVHYFNLMDLENNYVFYRILCAITRMGLYNQLLAYFKSNGMDLIYSERDLILRDKESIFLSLSEQALLIIFFTLYYIREYKGHVFILDNLEIFNTELKLNILNDIVEYNNKYNQVFISSFEEVESFENIKLDKCKVIGGEHKC